MLKVLIADDEKKVCHLIEMLIEWKELDLELIGTAYNGYDALDMIRRIRPDILITDIRMPGIDGIEVLRQVREEDIPIEVMVISGYTDFQYAQSAIRYGVVEYLLKPIKKAELNETLKKLSDHRKQEMARTEASDQLLRYMEDDLKRKRLGFFYNQLLSTSAHFPMSIEEINEKYGYRFSEGLFRVLIFKLDQRKRDGSRAAVKNVMQGLKDKFYERLAEHCIDMEICDEDTSCCIVCNYRKDMTHEFRTVLRKYADQIEQKRFQLGDMFYTIGMGKAVKATEELNQSLEDARNAVNERLLEGCDRLLEAPGNANSRDFSEIVSTFNGRFSQAMELLDAGLASESVRWLKDTIMKEQAVTGTGLLNAVTSAGIHCITETLHENSSQQIQEYTRECRECWNTDMLFDYLESTLTSLIERVRSARQDEERRPMRVARQYIMNHFMEAITLEQVAAQAGFSSSYFSSLFKKETGTGFAEYLTKLRMEKAKELLRTTSENVKDICVLVGYSDLKSFNVMFRKYTGLKPGEYRKLYG